jgi:hypothetical protein
MTAQKVALEEDAVRAALLVVWEASDRLCGKRLQAIMPVLVEAVDDTDTFYSMPRCADIRADKTKGSITTKRKSAGWGTAFLLKRAPTRMSVERAPTRNPCRAGRADAS